MGKSVYVWSDPGSITVSYQIVSDGKFSESDKTGVEIVAQVINKLKKEGYEVHLDKTWTGVNLRVHESIRSKLLKKLGMGESQTV
jgi:hypothetical protein